MDKTTIKERTFTGWHNGIVVAKARLSRQEDQTSYFSITTDNGCDHKSILAALGHLEDVKLLVSLHLSDGDGTPIHAEPNGLYLIREGKFDLAKKHLRMTDAELANLLKSIKAAGAAAENATTETLPLFRIDEEVKARVESEIEAREEEAIRSFIDRDLREKWKLEADAGMAALSMPSFITEEARKRLADSDPRKDHMIRIDEEALPCTVEYDNTISTGPAHQYVVFRDRKQAGIKAREHWKDMAENDPKEFTCMVGEETLVQWGLGRPAGPGSTSVCSLTEWLDLWLDTPEEHFASYDGLEIECAISAALADKLGIRAKKGRVWVPAVAYRC